MRAVCSYHLGEGDSIFKRGERVFICPTTGRFFHRTCWKIWKARGFPKLKEEPKG